jgi:hypothetical protein
MVFLYGSFIWGMIPSLAIPQNISWEGHLSGAIIGVLLAVFLRKEGPQKEVYHWEEEEEETEAALRQAQGPQGPQAQGPQGPQNQGPQGPLAQDSEDVSTGSTSEKPYWDVPTPSNDELTVQYRFKHWH